jgi:hypothetical protein
MRCALCLALTLLMLAVGSASADPPPDLGANAALKYWRAIATLPKFTDAEQTKLVAEFPTMPLDAHTREIVAKADYALRMMHQGAALPRCDWGIDWEAEGIEALLPYLSAARVLSSLACLRARLRFEEGRNGEALEDLIAAMTLSRHASVDGSFIAVLVGYNIEGRTSETLALYLPKLSTKMIKDLQMRLAALPPAGTQATALRACEEKTLEWFTRKVKETKDKDSLLSFLTGIGLSEGKAGDAASEKARAFLEECGGNIAGVIKFAEETRPSYAVLAKKLELPLDQFEKEFEKEKMKQAGNPVFKVFFPAIQKAREAQARAEVRRALFAAALAVQLDGRDALKNHPDPVVGGPFEYVAIEGGFELRSKFKGPDDKPLLLIVGQRGK